jgi:hypothetical protein
MRAVPLYVAAVTIIIIAALIQSYGAALTNLTGPIVSSPGFGIVGAVGGVNSGGGGGGGCNGTINLSTGCAQPMLGGA